MTSSMLKPIIGVLASKKISSWWLSGGVSPSDVVAAYQAKGAASLAASYVNLANPGVLDAFPGIAPAWNASDGWIGNANAYLQTNISVNGGAYTVICRFSNAVTPAVINSRLFGTSLAGNTNPRMAIIPNNGGNNRLYINGNGFLTVSGAPTSGVAAVASNTAYFNGASVGTTTAWSGTNNNPLYILTQNNGGSSFAPTSAYIQAMAIYSVPLTAPQVAAISAAMAAL